MILSKRIYCEADGVIDQIRTLWREKTKPWVVK